MNRQQNLRAPRAVPIAAGAGIATVSSAAAAWLAVTARAVGFQLWSPDHVVAAVVLWLGAALALWYAVTGIALLAGTAARLDLGVSHWGAPGVRRLGAGLALALAAAAPPALAAPALASSEDDLSWAAVAAVDAHPRAERAALKSPAASHTPASSPAPATTSYTVAAGDCLWSIAQREDPTAGPAWVAARVARYIQVNPTLAANPDLILPGQELTVPQEMP